MVYFKELFKVILYLNLAVATILVGGGLTRVLWETETLLKEARTTVQESRKRLIDTSQNTNAVLIQAGLAADEARRAAQEQRKYWAETAVETRETVAEARKLIAETNKTLNHELRAVSESSQLTMLEVQKQVGNLEAVTANAAEAARHTDEIVSGPEVKEILANTARASKASAEATEAMAGAAKDVEKVVHRVTQPKSLMVRVGTSLLGLSGKIWAFFVR